MPRFVQPTPEWVAFAKEHPCPECGAGPVDISNEMVEEFRFAPEDDEGRPMLYMPYEYGVTKGGVWEQSITCENGHVTRSQQAKWFDKPIDGPPLLRRGRA